MPLRHQILGLALAWSCAMPAAAEDLLGVYRQARKADTQLASAEAALKSAREGVVQARAALLPQLSGQYSRERTEVSGESPQVFAGPNGQPVVRVFPFESESRPRGWSLNLQQSIYDHANYTRLRAARAQVEAAEADYRSAEQNLAVRVAEAYFAVLTAQEALASAKAEEAAVKRQLEQAEQRFNVGLSAITDVHEARARYDGAVAAAILSENALEDARNALAEITGRPVTELDVLREELPLERPEPAEPQAWVEQALRNNPRVQAREFRLAAAEQGIATARAAHLPTLVLTGNYSDTSDTATRQFQGNSFPVDTSTTVQNLGIALRVPIFTGFATRSRVQQAVYDRDAVGEQLEADRRAITRQARNAYRAVLAGISEVQARQQALVSARSAQDATQAGFEVGTRTIVDVLLSQQVLYQAQRDYAQARHNFIVNTLRLRQAAGTVGETDIERINGLLRAPQ